MFFCTAVLDRRSSKRNVREGVMLAYKNSAYVSFVRRFNAEAAGKMHQFNKVFGDPRPFFKKGLGGS